MNTPGTFAAVAASPHTPIEASSVAKASNKPTLLIDKLSMTVEVPSKEHQQYVRGSLFDMCKPQDFPFFKYGWAPGVKGNYEAAVRIHFPVDEVGTAAPWSAHYALVQANPKNKSGGFVRIEWNPARLVAGQAGHLFEVLEALLHLSPEKLIGAKVTRLDIAVDVPDMRPGDYVWERPKSPLRHPLYNKGAVETLYLGSVFAGQITIYDKGLEQDSPWLKLTRIEARTRPNRALKDLLQLKNPFASLKAYAVLKADLGVGINPYHRQALHRAARAEGIESAFADLPQNTRAMKIAAAKASVATRWQPHEVWAMWPEVLKNVFSA